MSEEKIDKKSRLTTCGFIFTGVYLSGIAILLYFRWDKFVALDLNALGDFSAGAFSPLAFVWLILGYLQQGKELQLNTEALQFQGRELQNSVAESKALVETNKQHVRLLEAEKAESLAIDLFNSRLRVQVTKLSNFRTNHAEKFWQVGLRNIGRPMSEVQIMVNEPFKLLEIYIADFESGHERELVLVHPINIQDGAADIVFKFRDLSNRPTTGTLKFDLRAGGLTPVFEKPQEITVAALVI